MIRLILILALLPSVTAAAEQQKKKAPPVAGNPCAQYGDGFVRLPGTTTCVKLTGSIQVDVGTRTSPGR
jgi:hypothetical protein